MMIQSMFQSVGNLYHGYITCVAVAPQNRQLMNSIRQDAMSCSIVQPEQWVMEG